MIRLHPNTETATSYRVQSKKLKEQRYFPFKKYGGQEKAEAAAEKFEEELNKRKQAAELRSELDVNKLFDEYGNVKGLGFVNSSKRGKLIKAQFTLDGRQRSNTRLLANITLRDAYDELCAWIILKKDIEPTREIKIKLNKAFKLFEQRHT
jgi:hypothetical protein